MYSLLITIDQ